MTEPAREDGAEVRTAEAWRAPRPEGRLAGHTFHYSKSETPLPPLVHAETSSGRAGEAIYRQGRLTASYVHFYFPSNPQAVAALFS